MAGQFLFVLCPPYCGSTLLWKLLATSERVSALPKEGQFLPEVEPIMRERPWDRDNALPWRDIRAAWEQYWDHSKPILLEKSPPNIVRAQAIAEYFDPAQFIIMVRNPYAHAEGLMRRNEWPLRRAAHFALMCLRTQAENAAQLSNTLVFTYEDLVADPVDACAQLAAFQPALDDMDPRASFEVHSVDGTVDRQITDLNEKKIAALSPEQLDELNSFFEPGEDALKHWGYEIIPAS
ncbi:MAG: hypothetical protein HKN19_10800 [Halioglobus sp.]|nr:hypothetical protein [Halioglobus sp.]